MAPPGRRNALPRCRSLCCNDGGMPLAASRSAASRMRGRPSATAAASVSSSRRGSASGSARDGVRQRRPPSRRRRPAAPGRWARRSRAPRLGWSASTCCTSANPCTTSTQSGTGGTSSSCHIGRPRSAVASHPRSRSTASGVATASGTSVSTTCDQGRLERLRRRVLLDPHPAGVGLDARHDRPEPHPLADDRRGGAHPGGVERRHQPGRQVGQPLLALPPGRAGRAQARRPATHSIASA